MKTHYTVKASIKTQSGIALITVMVVLFILTLLGIAATDSSNFQALMTRNNQFRLETFNVSRSEIQDQLLALNAAPIVGGVVTGNDGLPAAAGVIGVANSDSAVPLFFAIDSGGQRVSTEDGSNGNAFAVIFPQAQAAITQNVAYQRVAGCPVFEESIGVVGTVQCHTIQVDSDAQLTQTNIQSLQSQTFSFISL